MSDLPTSGVSVIGLTEPLSPAPRLASATVELAAPAILPVYCLVCNVQGLEQVYWNVHASFTNTASVPLADKLLECVQSGLRAADLGRHYSEYVCGTCATQLNLVEEYEAALVRVRAEVKQGFWQTLIARGQISVTAEARDSDSPPPAVATAAPLAAATAAPLAATPKAVATTRDSGDAPVESRVRHPGPSSDDVVSERTQEVASVTLVTSVTLAVKSAVQGPVKVEVTAQVTEPEQLQEQVARATGTEQLQEQQQLAKQEDMIVGDAAPGPEETSAQSAGRCSSRPLRPVPRTVIDDPDEPDSPRPDESKADEPIQRSSGRTKTRTDWTEVDKHYRPVVDAKDGGTGRFQCTVCHSKIKDRKEVRKHVRRHLGMIKLLKCGFCEYRCYRPSNLAIHERRHTGERPFTCEVCGIGFKSNDGLNVHRRTHTGERPYQCEHCHKRFTQHSSLQIHKQVHSPQKRHICDYCGKSFTQLGNLKCHLRVHTGETPYPCPTCGRQFRSDYHLKVHQIEHTGRRPHQCRDCDLGFLTAHKLNLHRATHTGDKVGYPCGVCNKRLTTRKSLRDHERLHTGERPFPCATCAATFRTETLLRAHRRQHAVELQCAACGQTCRTEAALAAHQRTYHQPAAEPGAAAKPRGLQLLQIADSVSLAPAVLVTIGSPPPAQGESILGV